jgi:hypothetical protein
MINNNLLNGIASLLGAEAYTLPSHLAIGSTTGILSAADTVTSGEFDRNALDSDVVTNNLIKFVGRRLSTEANNEVVNIISLVNSNTLFGTGDIQAAFLVPSLVHTTNFDIDVEFWIRIQSA